MLFFQVSSVEVVQAYIDRIQEVNPLINAVVKDRQVRVSSDFIFPHALPQIIIQQLFQYYSRFTHLDYI